MNTTQAKAVSQSMASAGRLVRALKDFIYRAGIVAIGAILLFFLILLKSKTTANFQLKPWVFSYAIFVTAFELSRIVSAMFYKKSFGSLVGKTSTDAEVYEPRVAFVIPCKNEEKDIRNTVTKCFEVNYPREKLEVLVVNDGSTDGTMRILAELKTEYPDLRVVNWPKNQGKRWAMAAGFKISKAEIIIQMDSDSSVDPMSFRELVDPFQNLQVSAVCASGEPQNADKNILTKMQAAYYFMSFQILKAAESTYDTVFCCSGCCSAYRKSAVMPVLYDWLAESFLGKPVTWGDDRALTSHLLKRGGRTVFNDKAQAYTIVPENLKKLLVQQLRWKKSWIINFFFTIRFIFKKQPFVTAFYYLPLIAISFLTPIMAFDALVFTPLTTHAFPFYYVLGVLLITAIMALYYHYLDKNNKYWPYLFLWALFTMFVLSFVIVWAAVRIQDRNWGTR